MPAAEQIITDIKKGKYYPVYFLYGEESYFIDLISDFIEKNVLSEEEKSFNLQIFYGKDTSPLSIVESARRFPMMAKYQIVIIKEAQEINKTDNLTEYIKQPSPTTLLVINYKHKKLDRRTKFYQTLTKSPQCFLFESKKLYENKVPEWILQYVSQRNLSMDMKAALLLTEYVGNNLSNMVNELDKLMITLPEKVNRITPEHIEKYIGFSKDFNNLELQKAIINRDILKANRIAFYFCKNTKDHPFQLTITYLYYFFSKLLIYYTVKQQPRNKIASALKTPEYFLKDYEKAAQRYNHSKVVSTISLLRDMDVKSKGMGNVSASVCDLLKELIYKILH